MVDDGVYKVASLKEDADDYGRLHVVVHRVVALLAQGGDKFFHLRVAVGRRLYALQVGYAR